MELLTQPVRFCLWLNEMARKNQTSNRRAFRRNPSNFLDRVTKTPLSITIDTGSGPVQIIINPVSGSVQNTDDLPPGTTVEVGRDTENTVLP